MPSSNRLSRPSNEGCKAVRAQGACEESPHCERKEQTRQRGARTRPRRDERRLGEGAGGRRSSSAAALAFR